LNSRRPVIALIAIGAIIIGILTFVPYSLTMVKQVGHNVAAAVQSSLGKEHPAFEAEMRQPIVPQYDVALWYGARGEEPEKHGVLIQTLDGKRVFASHNADTTFNPASLVKLATSLIALKRLGPDFRFNTRVSTDGTVDAEGTLNGNLYLAGNDPTFGDASANLIANELRARGIKRVKEKILAAPGFSFNFNERAEKSAEFAAQVMQLKQSATGMSEAMAGTELFVLHSNPLREVLLYMNAHSNNFVADRLGAFLGGTQTMVKYLVEEFKLPPEQVSLETASGLSNNRMTPRGVLVVIKALNEEAARHGLKPEDVMAVVGCDWGTVRRRMEGTGFECALVGKTGTLTTTDGGMSNLAGIVFTKDSDPILFAILAQGNRIWEHKQMADQLLSETIHEHQPAPLMDNEARRQLLPPNSLRIESVSLNR